MESYSDNGQNLAFSLTYPALLPHRAQAFWSPSSLKESSRLLFCENASLVALFSCCLGEMVLFAYLAKTPLCARSFQGGRAEELNPVEMEVQAVKGDEHRKI